MHSRVWGPRKVLTLRGGQGGHIVHRLHAVTHKIVEIDCLTREGWRLDGCTLFVFQRMRRRRLIGCAVGQPYRMTRAGLAAVRSQLDQ